MPRDPFADEAPNNSTGPVVEQKDNWVSFSFVTSPGYDKVAATVHGEPDFIANLFAVQDFNGKISSLMKQAIEIDKYFKKLAGNTPGKA